MVLCHGIASDGTQMIPWQQAWREVMPDAAFAAPHAPFPHRAHGWKQWWRNTAGREWFALHDWSETSLAGGLPAAARMLSGFVDDQCERLGVPAQSVVLAGFSQGAMVALHAGLRRTVPPAMIVCLAGALLTPDSLTAEMRSPAPVLLLCGDADRVVPPSSSDAAGRVLRLHGVPVRQVSLPGIGHVLDPAGIALAAEMLGEVFA